MIPLACLQAVKDGERYRNPRSYVTTLRAFSVFDMSTQDEEILTSVAGWFLFSENACTSPPCNTRLGVSSSTRASSQLRDSSLNVKPTLFTHSSISRCPFSDWNS